MAQLTSIRRVTVIVDSILEQSLLEKFIELGARGYNVLSCRGKGQHGLVDNPLGGQAAQVRIETLVQPAVADKMMDYLHHAVFKRYAVTAWVDTVEVLAEDTY